MSFFQLITDQNIPASLTDVWDYISSPHNLPDICPPYMDFRITSRDLPSKMYQGMIITYKLRPMLGVPVSWMTEITHVEDHEFFVDEQRVGPYKLWHHQHHVREIEGGVAMRDIVTYQPPLGILGGIANSIFIKKQLQSIFNYRSAALEQRFGRWQ